MTDAHEEIRQLVETIQRLENDLRVAKFMLVRAQYKAKQEGTDLNPLFSEVPK